MTTLDDRLREIARSPVLLVASDYDGTLADIAEQPELATPRREALAALHALAALPHTNVAVVSGRPLADLAHHLHEPHDVLLVGSHGSEFDPDFAHSLPREVVALRDRVLVALQDITRGVDGARLEPKPSGVAVHYRNVERAQVGALVDAVRAGPASFDGVVARDGKEVLELCVLPTHKGDALHVLRRRFGASAVLFVGDDVTDEAAFECLTGPDLAIKVGEGPTCAPYRIDDPGAVARLLALLCELRSDWLYAGSLVPIGSHSFLSDQRTAALIGPDASVVWMCAPRLDSSALFADLLGGPPAGRFAIRVEGASGPPVQRYRAGTLVLESRFRVPTPDAGRGSRAQSVTVVDYLDCSANAPQRRAGRSDLIRVVEPSADASAPFVVEIEFAPRLDFGRSPTSLAIRDGGVEVRDTPDPIVLRAPGVTFTIVDEGKHQTARARCVVQSEPLVLELRYGSADLTAESRSERERRKATADHWRLFTHRLSLPSIATDLVRTSALVLKGLCYGPTGGIAAAATTSLPETLGGVRNWDYRYVWLRDAAMTAQALAALGSTEEGVRFLDWVLDVLEETGACERLRPLYTLTGHSLGSEGEIAELAGYGGSRPVRVGNAAAHQVQLDVFGPIVDLMWDLVCHGVRLTPDHWRLTEALVGAVAQRWQEPDHGIWELRDTPRHHVHSKVMCWLAVDRACRIAKRSRGVERTDWCELADAIAADVTANGWSEQIGAFASSYGSTELDAAVLHVGLTGLLRPDDPRFRATVDAIEAGLRDGATVMRYRFDDGLPGVEGGFHVCTAWLVDAMVMVGRTDDARRLFDEWTALAGPTGLLAEQHDPVSGRALGNFPQAYSHLGVVQNACRLARLENGH